MSTPGSATRSFLLPILYSFNRTDCYWLKVTLTITSHDQILPLYTKGRLHQIIRHNKLHKSMFSWCLYLSIELHSTLTCRSILLSLFRMEDKFGNYSKNAGNGDAGSGQETENLFKGVSLQYALYYDLWLGSRSIFNFDCWILPKISLDYWPGSVYFRYLFLTGPNGTPFHPHISIENKLKEES